MMSAFSQSIDAENPAEAVCRCFASQVTINADQVKTAPWPQTFDPDWIAWRWELVPGAEAPVDKAITMMTVEVGSGRSSDVPPSHPVITFGIVVDTGPAFHVGWFDGDESADSLCEYLSANIETFGS